MKAEQGKSETERQNNIFFIVYIIFVLFMAIIYFSVPERKDFIRFEIEWWREFIGTLASFF